MSADMSDDENITSQEFDEENFLECDMFGEENGLDSDMSVEYEQNSGENHMSYQASLTSLTSSSSSSSSEDSDSDQDYRCIGAIDGTHVSATIPTVKKTSCRGRKHVITQNVMCAMNFDMHFAFVYSGWGGSANDFRVFENAILSDDMVFPKPIEGSYYLVDSGYPMGGCFMPPHKSVRYHAQEYRGRHRYPKKLENKDISTNDNGGIHGPQDLNDWRLRQIEAVSETAQGEMRNLRNAITMAMWAGH
uniref:DDE Tnp4 domain-containing protein n=1 Tax=Fagus sylvatica TaxID=28930 RepID=A0A2N9IWU0_FAGSY